jgi:hypothetical protein
MTRRRRFLGILMAIAAPVVILMGYSNVPGASACNTINSIQANLGQAVTCSTTPALGYFVVAGILLVGGLLVLARGGCGGLLASRGDL